VVPGEDYLLTAWFRWETFEGSDWGSDRIVIFNPDWSEAASITKMHRTYERGKWHKLALAFTAQENSVRVSLACMARKRKSNFILMISNWL
jgi:hypothetical protein